MNLENLIEIMEMLGGELRPVSQWPLVTYSYITLEEQAATLDRGEKMLLAKSLHDYIPSVEYLDRFLNEVCLSGHLHSLFFYLDLGSDYE